MVRAGSQGLRQQGGRALFRHPNPQKSPLRIQKYFVKNFLDFLFKAYNCYWNSQHSSQTRTWWGAGNSVWASRVVGHYLDTQTLKNHPSGHPKYFVKNFLDFLLKAYNCYWNSHHRQGHGERRVTGAEAAEWLDVIGTPNPSKITPQDTQNFSKNQKVFYSAYNCGVFPHPLKNIKFVFNPYNCVFFCASI